MKKPSLFILSISAFLLLAGCGPVESSSTSEVPSVQDSTTTSETSSEIVESSSTTDDDPIIESHTISQYLTNPGFSGKLGDTEPNANFIKWFNTITLSDVLGSVESVDLKTETKPVKDETGEEITYICIGSGKSGAELTFNFTHDIKHFGLIVRSWYNYDDYNKVYHNDTGAELTISSGETIHTSKVIESTEEGKTPEVLIEFNLETPTNTFTLKNNGAKHRILLEKIELDY